MSNYNEDSAEDGSDEIDNELWNDISDDIKRLLSEEAEIQVFESSDDTFEIRILPKGLGQELEKRNDEISVTALR